MTTISAPNAPKAVGPYSQAIRTGNLLYCSGQIPINPATGKIEAQDVVGQTHQVVANLHAVLAGAGLKIQNVLKSTLFLQNLDDVHVVDPLLAEGFEGHKPARSTVEASKLPLGSLVEVEIIAGYP